MRVLSAELYFLEKWSLRVFLDNFSSFSNVTGSASRTRAIVSNCGFFTVACLPFTLTLVSILLLTLSCDGLVPSTTTTTSSSSSGDDGDEGDDDDDDNSMSSGKDSIVVSETCFAFSSSSSFNGMSSLWICPF